MEGHAPEQQQQQPYYAPSEQHVEQQGGGGRRETGIVKWFNAIKGFGFITPTSTSISSSQPAQPGEEPTEEGPQDLFVHQV